MQDDIYDLTETGKNNGIPKFVEEMDPTLLGNVVLLGKRLSTTVFIESGSFNEDETF
jgi:hypothetical protein